VAQIHANQYHTCALLNTGQVRCWGYNEYGQLGNGGTGNRALPVKVQV
jgi:alpha-tubulin suppressor-like RCC1 family protein